MPHPFRWQPGEGKRHATLMPRPRGGFPDGTEVDTLCGTRVAADNSDIAWLWSTCTECNEQAHAMAGTPGVPPSARS